MKKKIFIFGFSLFFLVFTLFYFLFLFLLLNSLFKNLVQNRPSEFKRNFSCWQAFTKPLWFLNKINEQVPDLLGFADTKTYFILIQNHWELRPSGGFMGSYAKIKFSGGGLADFQVQDIYVPDGQLKAHVEPPWPIQLAFQQGWWRLRDANWEPDFPTASQQIAWFFEKGGEEKSDGLIAINLLLIKDLLEMLGPLNLADYDQEINAANFQLMAQTQAEEDFFPGSTQKKDFLQTLSTQFFLELPNLDPDLSLQLIKVLKRGLKERQILIYTNNDQFNQLLDKLGWTGALKRNCEDNKKQVADFVYLVESNLGSNKANGYVKRDVIQKINLDEGRLGNKLIINYANESIGERPAPPDFWGGLYENFLRLLIPLEAENINIKVDGREFNGRIDVKEYQEKKIKSIGFFVEVPPLSEVQVEIDYEKRLNQSPHLSQYVLEIQKQPGIEEYVHQIELMPQSIKTQKIVRRDSSLKFKIKL